MNSNYRPPARLTASATLKLPRLALFAFCLIYILAGLLGRDPWKTEDATGFGVMWTMAHGGLSDWLLPNVVGAVMLDDGPLMFWVGALAIKMFSFIEAAHAARLANVFFFLLGTRALWSSCVLLGRRPAAQPPALVFGGQPDPRDYGRTLADGAVLIFIGTAGLLTRMHESSSDAAMLSMLLIAMYAMARSLERPIPGALWMAAALIGLGLSAGLLLGLTVGLAWLALLLIHPDLRAARIDFVRLTAPLTLAGLLIWPALAWWLLPDGAAYLDNLTQYRAGTFGLVPVSALAIYAKNLGWYTWPAWPLAAWGVWSWRHHIATAHMAFPLALLMATGTTLLLGTDFSEANMLALLPALTVLATFGLPTLKRGAANGIDWFSLMIFSCAALLIWLGWVAMTTGFPPKIAANFARQTAGFLPGFNAGAFVLALLASVAWIVLVHWRLSRHPKSLWRSVVLSAAGLTLSWFLLMSLWLPSINYSKTYRVVASQLAGLVRDDACLQSENLGLAQRASFAYFSGLHFAPIAIDGSQPECAFLLRQDHQRQILPTQPAATHGTGWEQIWEGQRPSDRDERFRLYRRAVQPSMASTPK